MVTVAADPHYFRAFDNADELKVFNHPLNYPVGAWSNFTNETTTGFDADWLGTYAFTGTGLTYDGSHYPAGGSITGVRLPDDPVNHLYSLTGFSISVAAWNAMASTGNFAAQFLAGDDTVVGGSLSDTLNGEGGNDRIFGGGSIDVLTGGSGDDTFVFSSVHDIGYLYLYRDIVTDFAHGHDRLDLSGIDANTKLHGNNKFTFLAAKGAPFTHHAGQLHWCQFHGATIVEGDTNGDAHPNFAIELTHKMPISVHDLIL